MAYVQVYDQSGRMLAVLENAGRVEYELKHNDLWSGSFELPAADPKNEYCQARNLVRLPDGTRDTGLYRIVGVPDGELTARGGVIKYQLEHVMATLFDDILFGYHEVGGEDVMTAQVIAYILARQRTARWQLGRCDFTDEYQYSFENVTLLSALMSVAEPLQDEYTWVFDTATTPWTVSLVRAETEASCGIHYGRSLTGIHKTMDASALCTQLYPLGYGEGVNQLTIKSVNNGVPYIESDTIGIWGPVSNVWTDTRIEDPALLLAKARRVLEGYKNPYYTYRASAIDLYRQTGQSWDNCMPGRLVRVMDEEDGVTLEARVKAIRKGDLFGDPGSVEITIANAPRDAADQISTLAEKAAIGELYSQGATNIFAQSWADNADADHPATFRFYVPQGLRRINEMRLSWRLENFRAYSTGAASGGGGTRTSSSGGAVVATATAQGAYTLTTEQEIVSGRHLSGGVVGNLVTQSEGAHSHTVDSHYHNGPRHQHAISSETATDFAQGITGYTAPDTNSAGAHTHELYDHYHELMVSLTIPPLQIDVPSHDHSVSIPDHQHTVGLPTHTHDIVYGIYEGGRAQSVTIRVDGNAVPASAIQHGECDVTAWMSADEDGRIQRGQWHVIELVPDRLTRIEANLYAQCFIQSLGGGDY